MLSTMGFQLHERLGQTTRRVTQLDQPLVVVDKVAETGRVNDSQLESYPVLLDLCRSISTDRVETHDLDLPG